MKFITSLLLLFTLTILFGAVGVSAQIPGFILDSKRQSARSDKLTGGRIEKTTLESGNEDLKITINVPSFQMTLWQNGREVKTYPVGVGMIDYPIYIGVRQASAIVWNPDWIPPDSDWVEGSKKVTAGEIILPTDPRNPLGKLKIPLGYGYLIHQAKSAADLGSLVSHGCVRVMQNDLYDLAEKIMAARSLPATPEQIAEAKATKKTLLLEMNPPVRVEITYDAQVVEAGRLHIYPDVYARQVNTAENLRDELESSGIKTNKISDSILNKMLAKAVGKNQFVVSVKNIEAGTALTGGQILPVVSTSAPAARKPVKSRKK